MRISDWSSDVCSSDLEIVGEREVDVAQHFLAVKAAIDEVDFAARVEVGGLADEVDEAADRSLAEQHRCRAAHDLDAREIIGVRGDQIGRASCRERVCQYV